MVKPPFNLFQIEMEVFLWHSSVMVKPVLGVRPEALDAVKMIAALGSTLFFLDYHMIPSNIEKGIGMPVIGVVEACSFGMRGK